MKLSELLASYGDNNYVFQNLDNDIIQLDDKKKHREYKFGSFETFGYEGTQKLGLVVWLDREKVKDIIAKETKWQNVATQK